jgi:hypothetical protein
MWGAALLRQDGDILRQFRKAVDPEVAATPSSLATFLGCADMGLSTVECQCFYLAVLIGRMFCVFSPIVNSLLCYKQGPLIRS